MEFAVYDLNKDAVEISVFDKDLFSPNGKTVCKFLYLLLFPENPTHAVVFVRTHILSVVHSCNIN